VLVIAKAYSYRVTRVSLILSSIGAMPNVTYRFATGVDDVTRPPSV
jgi:hypothetical protein